MLLIDTYSLFFRAFHALPPMTTTAGQPTSALYGLSALLLKLLRERKPVGLAFALDAPQKTFRHEQRPDYKSGRAAVPSALARQFPLLDELLEALAVPAFRVAGYEADDVLATLSRELALAGLEPLVVTGDRDLLQVATGGARVLFVGSRGKEPTLYDELRVQERFGVPPERLPTYVALVGDPSDNLPRVPGIGPRTASQLVSRYASADALLAAVHEQPSEKLRARLLAHAEQIQTSEHLARLRSDVDLGSAARYGRLTGDTLDGLVPVFTRLEFKSLLPRLEALKTDLTQE